MAETNDPTAIGADEKLDRCETLIGYRFNDRALLLEALTHASGAAHRLLSNERMEFLGDAILGFLVCEYLFQRFPDWDEGQLTRVKSALVSRATCARLARRLGLQELLVVGKGIEGKRSVPSSLLSNAFESIIAAIYLDGGIKPLEPFVMPHVREELDQILTGQAEANFKSELQQLFQQKGGEPPDYLLLDESGPDHKKRFLVCVVSQGNRFPPAWGASKKQAEQRSAGNALAHLSQRPLPYPADDLS